MTICEGSTSTRGASSLLSSIWDTIVRERCCNVVAWLISDGTGTSSTRRFEHFTFPNTGTHVFSGATYDSRRGSFLG